MRALHCIYQVRFSFRSYAEFDQASGLRACQVATLPKPDQRRKTKGPHHTQNTRLNGRRAYKEGADHARKGVHNFERDVTAHRPTDKNDLINVERFEDLNDVLSVAGKCIR